MLFSHNETHRGEFFEIFLDFVGMTGTEVPRNKILGPQEVCIQHTNGTAIRETSGAPCNSLRNYLYICMNENEPTPSGIDTVEISEELARMKAQKHKFSYYDADDIAQEIWLSVNKAAKKFDGDRVKKGKRPLSFFNVASENALKNLKRDNKIADNVNLGDTPVQEVDHTIAGEMRARELRQFILDKLPDKLKEPFIRLVDYGGEGVSQYIKTKIRHAVAEILEEFNGE